MKQVTQKFALYSPSGLARPNETGDTAFCPLLAFEDSESPPKHVTPNCCPLQPLGLGKPNETCDTEVCPLLALRAREAQRNM